MNQSSIVRYLRAFRPHSFAATAAAVCLSSVSAAAAFTEPRRSFSNARSHFQQHRVVPPPSVPHANLSTPIPKRVLVIGDIHGCFDELLELHEKAVQENDGQNFSAVVCVGDLVNKGPYSAEVVRHVHSQPRWYSVRGNHDESGLLAAMGGKRRSEDPKYSWVQDLSAEDVVWLSELPYTLWIDELNTMVVHAGFVPGVEYTKQDPKDMVTLREVTKLEEHQFRRAGDGDPDPKPWAQEWSDSNPPYKVIFGHDAKRGLQQYSHALGLDSGCCYGKKLTAVILPEGTLVHVEAKSVYSPIVGKQ